VARLVLVRHGESVANVERFIGGLRTCRGLSETGRRQADALRERLIRTGEIAADVLVTSPMPRARETAELIAPAFGEIPRLEVAGLAEHDPGEDCDGLTYDEFVARHGHVDWATEPYLHGFPGGETVAAFQLRAATALAELIAAHDEETLVVVCHGGVIDTGLRTLLKLPMVGGFLLETVNTSLTELSREGTLWRLVRYNDAAHLRELAP
jgi:probable phosphoglycerate mutase